MRPLNDIDIGYERAELRIIDLAKFSSVKAFAESLQDCERGVDIAVLNAGVAMVERVETEDGWETE